MQTSNNTRDGAVALELFSRPANLLQNATVPVLMAEDPLLLQCAIGTIMQPYTRPSSPGQIEAPSQPS